MPSTSSVATATRSPETIVVEHWFDHYIGAQLSRIGRDANPATWPANPRWSSCDLHRASGAIPVSSLTVHTSQEAMRATMYNPRKGQGNAMATTSHFDARLTYDDLVRMPDDGMRHEIIDGVHYVTPAPILRHQRIVGRLFQAIANYLDLHPGVGEAFGAPVDTVFTRWDVVEPDVVFVAADQRSILTEPNIQGAPALVVEILSPGTKKRDLGIKKELFDRGGVREYWIVDPKGNTVAIHRRTASGGFPKVASLPADAHAITTALLPGFSLPLEKLFRD